MRAEVMNMNKTIYIRPKKQPVFELAKQIHFDRHPDEEPNMSRTIEAAIELYVRTMSENPNEKRA